MTRGPETATIEIVGDTLRASGELGPPELPRFEEALHWLLETAPSAVSVDLVGVHHVSASLARLIARSAEEAKRAGRDLVVRARRRALLVLHVGGVSRLGTIQPVDTGQHFVSNRPRPW